MAFIQENWFAILLAVVALGLGALISYFVQRIFQTKAELSWAVDTFPLVEDSATSIPDLPPVFGPFITRVQRHPSW
jgi:hypothetical protein